MATNTLTGSINFASPFVKYIPLTAGTNSEPAITIGNIIKQTILGPPFTWSWNRAVTTIPLVQGTQDYTVTLSTWGYLEKVALTDSSGKIWELKDTYNRLAISPSSDQARPNSVSVALDNGSGQITFRFMGVPDAAYTATVIYQNAPPLFTATNQTWAPIPDGYSDIYNNWFLSFAYDNNDDPRAAMYRQRAVYGLLAKSEGLTEMQRNMFLQQWLRTDTDMMDRPMKHQQGIQARGM